MDVPAGSIVGFVSKILLEWTLLLIEVDLEKSVKQKPEDLAFENKWTQQHWCRGIRV